MNVYFFYFVYFECIFLKWVSLYVCEIRCVNLYVFEIKVVTSHVWKWLSSLWMFFWNFIDQSACLIFRSVTLIVFEIWTCQIECLFWISFTLHVFEIKIITLRVWNWWLLLCMFIKNIYATTSVSFAIINREIKL